ncbi:hypothetical protein [Promicromonospora soli]|uniref:Uncharacterized protein n=1 Tax=Promicromonospora soli TaxID=2035533 RepID=A0A919G471_9MICO|nr:hypothetical protein [Promicromonospora soli]GHH77586.1 hypothetical protein GCM10017772_38930 [Promicromonospora soli]
MHKHVWALLGALAVFVVAGLLSSCMTDASTANFTAPEEYATVEQLVADADVVALVRAGGSRVDIVDDVPYTRTELQLRKVLLGAVGKHAELAVTQVGSGSSPPGAGLPSVLRDGHEYVVALNRTAAGEFEVVGPGVWRADTMGASLTLHTAKPTSVPAAIPHVTTPWELEVELGKVRESLGTSVVGRPSQEQAESPGASQGQEQSRSHGQERGQPRGQEHGQEHGRQQGESRGPPGPDWAHDPKPRPHRR